MPIGYDCFQPTTDFVRVSATVWYVINDNFALAETSDTNTLALFDTFDFYVTQKGTAAEAQKSLKDVIAVGQKIKINACYIGKEHSIPYLCTSVWKNDGAGLDFEPLPKGNIQPDKVNIHAQVRRIQQYMYFEVF